MSIGLTFPLGVSTGSFGYLATTQTIPQAVRENLRCLLNTNWGERVMRYDFGCNLVEFIFTNDRSDDLRDRIADRIIGQVSKWMPFVSVDELFVIFPEDEHDFFIPENGFAVNIKFSLSSRPDLSDVINEVF